MTTTTLTTGWTCPKGHQVEVSAFNPTIEEDGFLEFSTCSGFDYCDTCDSTPTRENVDDMMEDLRRQMHEREGRATYELYLEREKARRERRESCNHQNTYIIEGSGGEGTHCWDCQTDFFEDEDGTDTFFCDGNEVDCRPSQTS